ncbi:hypothetical protein JTP94_11475 [Rhizobium lusitanum]|nr:hypothetical protein [Rhizobium lusitanum]
MRPGRTLVWSRDEQGNEGYKLVLKRFLDKHSETVYLTLQSEGGHVEQTITTTTLHRVFAVLPQGASKAAQIAIDGRFYSGPIRDGVWIAIKDLKPGDRMLDDDGSWSTVVSMRIEAKSLDAYNLTVADYHTYFVKQPANDNAKPVWMHNTNCQILGDSVLVVPNNGSSKVYNRIQLTSFGETVYDGALDLRPTMNEISQNAGSNGAHEYLNNSGLLPGSRGSSNNYTTYVVNIPGIESSPARLLYSSDGSIRFTPNHYESFIKVK